VRNLILSPIPSASNFSASPLSPLRLLPRAAETPKTLVFLLLHPSAWSDKSPLQNTPLYKKLCQFSNRNEPLGHVPLRQRTPFRIFYANFHPPNFRHIQDIRTRIPSCLSSAIHSLYSKRALHAQECPTTYRLPAQCPP